MGSMRRGQAKKKNGRKCEGDHAQVGEQVNLF
jgi:hypothetical protein